MSSPAGCVQNSISSQPINKVYSIQCECVQYGCNRDVLHQPLSCNYHVTYQHQLRRITAIKVSIVCTLQNLADISRSSGYFLHILMSIQNSNILILSHTVFLLMYSREECDFGCCLCFPAFKSVAHVLLYAHHPCGHKNWAAHGWCAWTLRERGGQSRLWA